MCGRYNLIAKPEQLIEHFKLQRLRKYESSYNIAPGQKILTIVRLEDSSYKAVNLWWGLIPSWSKDRSISNRLINARAETVKEKPAFRAAYKKRRCLIPATGFYEWQKTENEKQAFHIHRQDQRLFAFAGLWEHWEYKQETVYSCTIITTSANRLMQPVHNRMPVIISLENYNRWLDKRTSSSELDSLLAEDSYQEFILSEVSDWVNNPIHDDKNCLENYYKPNSNSSLIEI